MSKSELWKPTSITPVMKELEKSNDYSPHSFKLLAGSQEAQNIQFTGTSSQGFNTAILPDGTAIYI